MFVATDQIQIYSPQEPDNQYKELVFQYTHPPVGISPSWTEDPDDGIQ
jgi:hypothetical protein